MTGKLSVVREGKGHSERSKQLLASGRGEGGVESYTPKVHHTSLGLATWHTG